MIKVKKMVIEMLIPMIIMSEGLLYDSHLTIIKEPQQS